MLLFSPRFPGYTKYNKKYSRCKTLVYKPAQTQFHCSCNDGTIHHIDSMMPLKCERRCGQGGVTTLHVAAGVLELTISRLELLRRVGSTLGSIPISLEICQPGFSRFGGGGRENSLLVHRNEWEMRLPEKCHSKLSCCLLY